MRKLRKAVLVTALAVGCIGAGTTASWAAFTFEGSSGTHSASVTFSVSGGSLTVTLVNTAKSDVMVPTDVLTAVFFDTAPSVPLDPGSATLAPGSTVLFGTTDPGGVVGGEWAYASGVGSPTRAGLGISSAGLGLFGPQDRFPGNNLQGPSSPDGLQYGITSAGDNPATGNAAVRGANALIKNAVVFTLTINGAAENLTFNNVLFQYGTALSDGSYTGTPVNGNPVPVPEASTLIAGALLLLPFGASTLRIRRRNRKA